MKNYSMSLLMSVIFTCLVVFSALAEEVSPPAVTPPEEAPPGRKALKTPEAEELYRVFDPLHDRYFGNFRLSTRFHGRLSFNASDNLVDLDDSVTDSVEYIGYQYDVTLSLKHISTAEFFMQLKRDVISEYDAPLLRDDRIKTLFGDKPLTDLFGEKHEYTESEFLPRLHQLYFDVPVTDFLNTRIRTGFYRYIVGNGYALGGKYPNVGATLFLGPDNLRGRIHYHRVDLYNKQSWGPTIDHHDEGNFNGRGTNADFYAADLMAKFWKISVEPYIGFLHDHTSPSHRFNLFDNFNLNGTRINDDLLGTVGIDLNIDLARFNYGIEFARNFGRAHSSDKHEADRGDITHKGWLLVSDAGYRVGLVRPNAKFVWASGPSTSRRDAQNFRNHIRNNRSFSVFSPTNGNIFDSHYQRRTIGPYVASGATDLLNFGIDRPGVFNDPVVIENVIFINGGLEFFPINKLYFSLDYWNMHADEPGFGLNSAGEVVKLPSELGHEMDFYTSYAVTRRLSLNLQGGFFIPGEYYRKDRAETGLFTKRGLLGLSPVLPRNGRGNPDDAFLMAFGMDYSF